MNATAVTPLEARREQPGALGVAATVFLAWLAPGAGYLAHGRLKRGMALFLVLNATFALGLAMNGGVVWPPWNWRDPNSGFNIVNNLTFILQMGAGLPAIASLAAGKWAATGWTSWLAADPSHPLYDLSSFYLLVAGAMNYFAVCGAYDWLYGKGGTPPAETADDPKGKD